MARNYSREARLSKLYANRIVFRAFFAILLYCFAVNLVVGYGSLFVLGYLTTEGNSTIRRVLSIIGLVVVAELAIYIIIRILFLKSEKVFRNMHLWCNIMFLLASACIYLKMEQMLSVILVGAASFVSMIIELFIYINKIYVRKPQYYRETLKALRHNRRVENAKVRMLHGLWRSLSWGKIPEGKTQQDVDKEKEEVIRLLQEHRRKAQQANRKVGEYKEFFIKNRYAKNEFVETRFRRARRYMHQLENAFVVMVSMFAFIFFAILTILAQKVADNTVNGQGPALWDYMDPEINPEFFYLYIAMVVVFVFHFICALIAGSVTQVKLYDHANTYVHVNATARIDGMDMNIHPNYNSGLMSIPRKWDDSNAILEEKPREYKLTMFFLRNVMHVLFAVSITVLFIYLTPALVDLWGYFEEQNNTTFALIYKILYFVLIDSITGAMYYALSTREYEYECMDEHLMRWRYRHTAFMALFIILSAAYLVLLLIGGHGFNTVVYGRVIVCIGCMLAISVATFLVNLIMLPKERRKVNKDIMVFSNLDDVTNAENDYQQYYH